MARRCRVCGRKLRSPLWRAAGLGPVCARRLGLRPARSSDPAVKPGRAVVVELSEDQLPLFEIDEKGAA